MEIRRYREANKLSQREVADATGVDVSTVTKWEAGVAYPRAKHLPVLADLFGCTIDALYGREPPGEREQDAS